VYAEEDLLPLSSLQHYSFCPRQCGLIHLEGYWQENIFTAEGRVFHENVDTIGINTRGVQQIERGIPIRSLKLGLIGKTDVVEYHHGIPFPIEYKRGRPKSEPWDGIQLCAQAIRLEEMMNLKISQGALYYGKIKRRVDVEFCADLREKTEKTAAGVHELIIHGVTPTAFFDRNRCPRCSLRVYCLPLEKRMRKSISTYLQKISSE